MSKNTKSPIKRNSAKAPAPASKVSHGCSEPLALATGSAQSSCISFYRDKNAVIIKSLMPIDAPVTIPVKYAKHIAKTLVKIAAQPYRPKREAA